MKKNAFCAVVIGVTFLIGLLGCSPSAAAQIRASRVFEGGYVMADTSLYVEFGASAHIYCEKIYVSSCTLQEVDVEGNVISSKALTPPSTVAKNAFEFTASASYKDKGVSGKSYQVKAVFWAEGETITRTSVPVTFK